MPFEEARMEDGTDSLLQKMLVIIDPNCCECGLSIAIRDLSIQLIHVPRLAV